MERSYRSAEPAEYAVRLCVAFHLAALLTMCCVTASGQQSTVNPQQLVREAVAKELGSPFVVQNCSYQYHRRVSGRDETLLMIRSSDLIVGKLVRVDGASVSADQQEQQDKQLRRLLEDSRERQRQLEKQQKFERYIRDLVEALPDSFQYTEAETEVGPQGRPLVHLNFQPSPSYEPAHADQQVLRGLAGTMVIDRSRKQIVRLDAHLFKDVDFGWGVLVSLNKGGGLLLVRDPDGPPESNIQTFSLNVDGRILLLKKLDLHWSFDHFAALPGVVDLASAIDMLTTSKLASYLPH
ncbi:MAG TPA: hypothetical protein VH437_02095 [Terriglobales bacterium]|jgi:hypothetical protein